MVYDEITSCLQKYLHSPQHHVAVLWANHIRILCMGLCVNDRSHAQYTYMIGLGAQPRGAPRSCKYFSHAWQYDGNREVKIFFFWVKPHLFLSYFTIILT